jgi:hypothetical protein
MKTGPAARARGLVPWLVPVVLAFAVGFAWATNPGPQWRVAPAQSADGNALFDGDPVPAGDAASMNDRLVAGTTIEWRGHGDLELLSPGHAILSVAPGTVFTLPAPPPRWFARASSGRLAEGRLRFVPGPRFRGARLVVETPARTFTAAGDAAFEIAHDPASGRTRVDASGAGITEFARTRRPSLAE